MRKISIVLLGLIAGFALLGLSPVTTVNAQEGNPHIDYLVLYLSGLSIAVEGSSHNDYGFFGNITDYYVAIAGNNIAFAWGTRLNRLTLSGISTLAHGWYMHLGISKFAELRDSPFYYFTVNQLKSVGSIFPGVLEAYNDSNNNGVCDTFFNRTNPSDNASEVLWYLHLEDYDSYEIMNLTPTKSPAWRPYQSEEYTWGINYTDVTVQVYDAQNWVNWALRFMNGTETMSYCNISYTLKFSSNGDTELFQNLHFGELTDTDPDYNWTGLGLSVLQFDVAQTLDFDIKVNVDARDENGTVRVDPENSTIMTDFTLECGTKTLMELDLTSSKPTYIWDKTTPYNVSATSCPWFTATYTGYVEDNTYSHTAGWTRVREWFQHRICYNKWDGEEIDHDPIFGMESPLALIFTFNYNPKAWVPSAIIGGLIAIVAGIMLIVAVVKHRREK
ncbi:MAG: hypothetical protein HWN67_16765 [Candidatus Helarchaeota archaeon]|nr:hypothetical protein [Candidatus Helarchaeota archaeon]